MSRLLRFVLCLIAGASFLVNARADETRANYSVVAPIGLGEARWTGGFWCNRFDRCRTGSLPTMTRIMQETDHSQFLHNFKIAAGLAEGHHRGSAWNDGDTYKWLEAMAAVYAVTRDAELDRELDSAIALIAQAQRADGYLHTPVLIKARELAQRKADSSNTTIEAQPFHNPQQFEMYNFGHLCTAACVHFQATGKRHLLDVAIKAADYLDTAFARPTDELARHAICPSHYMGLIDLHRVTGEKRYLALVERWLQMRDVVAATSGGDDNQDRLPFRQQTEAVGHAVRANYLYAGVADLYLEAGDPTLLPPLQTLWRNVVTRKMYITGACGALFDGASPAGSAKQTSITRIHQAYGQNYQLPQSTAHNETCATVGNVLWNDRMLRATGDARHADIVETALLNGALAGVSLNGEEYFYTNTLRQLDEMPVELRWSRTRQPFIKCFCCPPNIVRLLAESSQYAYGRSENAIWVHQYGSSALATEFAPGKRIVLRQETGYPWHGRVKLELEAGPESEFAIKLRIPAWCRGATVAVNSTPAQNVTSGAYHEITRTWKAGDTVTLEMPMPVRLVAAHPLVEEARNQVAVQRGPLVYCLESSDLPPGIRLQQVAIPADILLTPYHAPELLDGVTLLEGTAHARMGQPWQDSLYRDLEETEVRPVAIKLIPYYAWSNRGPSEMSVWLPLSTARTTNSR